MFFIQYNDLPWAVCVQVFIKFAVIVKCHCSSQASTTWFYLWSGCRLVHKIAKSDTNFVKAVCLSVCLSTWKNSAPTGWIFMKFEIWVWVKEIKQYQEKWLQHIQRMDTNRIPKQALQYKPKDEDT